MLAGTRAGGDPLAEYAGVSHKALIEVGGRTMVERVVEALAAAPEIERIVVAIERPELLAGLAGLQPPRCAKPLQTMPTEPGGPSATVAAALRALGVPLLVTTADNALLETAWLSEFLAAIPAEADLAAALARRDAVEAAAPDTRRTWLRFADGDYSGCNLFLLARPAAASAIAFWQTLEGERKRPLRMVRRLGWTFAAALRPRPPVDGGGGGAPRRARRRRPLRDRRPPRRPGGDRRRQARRSRPGAPPRRRRAARAAWPRRA